MRLVNCIKCNQEVYLPDRKFLDFCPVCFEDFQNWVKLFVKEVRKQIAIKEERRLVWFQKLMKEISQLGIYPKT